jgi:hypothetical protein
LELQLKEIMSRDPLSTNMGLAFFERLEEKDLAMKQRMMKPTLSSKITNPQ